jgi:NAD(P)-dependent dehydrogenase (short-subunit alcohol dehydrogenase family)
MLESFEGAVAVVTGGGSGIGRGIALELHRRGADVAIADINEARLAQTVAELSGEGRPALGRRCDVILGPPEGVPMDDWEWILQVNVLGLVRGVRVFVPAMLERGRGHVVNTASIAGTWAYSWDAAPYITSKFAAYGFSEALARRLKPHGIGVSVLCPGLVSTNLAETARFSGVPEPQQAEWSYFPPDMQQAVQPEDVGVLVADAILDDRFVIFTHNQDVERYRTWRSDIDRSLADIIEASPPPPVLK